MLRTSRTNLPKEIMGFSCPGPSSGLFFYDDFFCQATFTNPLLPFNSFSVKVTELNFQVQGIQKGSKVH
jgi:hypothetical protein